MSYTAIPTVSDEDWITATWWNTYVRDNFEAGIPAIYTSKGDVAVGSGANAADRLPVGDDGQMLEADSGESLGVKWSWNYVPVGGIIMWAGALGSLPGNWELCDGANGTPDLRNRFVLGAGGSYGVGSTGGAESLSLGHDHESGGAAGTSSTETNNHGHGVSSNTGAGSNHTHTLWTDRYDELEDGVSPYADAEVGGGYKTKTNYFDDHRHPIESGAESSHVHSVPNANAADASHSHTIGFDGDELGATDIRPPYYALAFIQRVS